MLPISCKMHSPGSERSREKILSNNTKPVDYWHEETGQFVKGKKKVFEMD
jgi:hypothetical protein